MLRLRCTSDSIAWTQPMTPLFLKHLFGRRKLTLRDKVPRRAHTIFVGINPAIESARQGHYYAHPTNAFWRILSDSGIAPRKLTAKDDDWMVRNGFGFTDVAKRPTIGAGDLDRSEWIDLHSRLNQIMVKDTVRTMVFVSKYAARAFLGKPMSHPIKYGEHRPYSEDGPSIWFVPSTSGQSYRDTTYDQKVSVFSELAAQIASYYTWDGGEAGSNKKTRQVRIRARTG